MQHAQFLVGLGAYLYPKASLPVRAGLGPVHKFVVGLGMLSQFLGGPHSEISAWQALWPAHDARDKVRVAVLRMHFNISGGLKLQYVYEAVMPAW